MTGASGSGKSSLIHEIVQKRLYSLLHDSRVLAGEHDELTGSEHISDVIDIDQSPIGRSSRSNPATYIGFYDAIRTLFAETDEAKRRGFTASTFSFNVKGGRCEECTGEGTITTQLSFMPDVEVLCPTCKGARYNQDTLEVKYQGKNIAEVLDLSVEEGVAVLRGPTDDRPQDRRPERAGPRLPQARPSFDDPLRRRSPARQARRRARQAQARQAQPVHPRRADDGPALRRHRSAAAKA